MARKSRSELSIIAPVKLGALPEPPAELSETESALWHQIVATKPADWWDGANYPMLRALVVHSSAALIVDQALRDFQAKWLSTNDGLARYISLSKLRVMHTGKIESLSTKMRLSQQARYTAKSAETAARKVIGQRPWEG